jgi:hypothetical protein
VRFWTLPGFHNLEVNGSNPFAATDFPLHGLSPHSGMPLKPVFLGGPKAP